MPQGEEERSDPGQQLLFLVGGLVLGARCGRGCCSGVGRVLEYASVGAVGFPDAQTGFLQLGDLV
ncbi:hypothetical protein, partial [Streptomyces sp. NRRL S-31]|uniref:hypothetical protein n=1 Tax=Streptomyces sp. NRRL S-31 TaxID=1463898 RepID=UPI001C1E8AA8